MIGVDRTADGARGLSEVAVLTRGPDGYVTVLPAWLRGSGFTEHAPLLTDLIERRRR